MKLRISEGGEERIGVSLEIILRDLTRKVEVRIEDRDVDEKLCRVIRKDA